MHINQPKPVCFAIAHLFTTGRDSTRHSIIHVACIRYEVGSAPQMNDWLVNPGLAPEDRIKNRVVKRTGLNASHLREQPLWRDIRSEVLSFLAGVDYLFVRNSDVASQWFQNSVYEDMASPTLIGLTEMYQFFLPDQPAPYSDSMLIELGESIKLYTGSRTLYKVMNGMYRVMDRILRIILLRKEINNELHYPVYSLLDWALSAEGHQPTFDAIYKIASIAHKIQWNQSQTEIQWDNNKISGMFTESPSKMENNMLIKYIKDWKPFNLISEDRKPLRENYMASEIPDQYEQDSSARNLFHIVRFLTDSSAPDSGSAQDQIEDVSKKVEYLIHKMQNTIFQIMRRLYGFAHYLNDWENQGACHYPNRYEELHQYIDRLSESLANITDQLKPLFENELFMTCLKSFDPQLKQLISKWILEVSDRSHKLNKSLHQIRHQFPKPSTPQLGTALRKAINEFKKYLQDLSKEYWSTTNPILKEYGEQDFRELFSAMGASFVRRTEQQKYAKFIKEGINLGGMYGIEAGTGTGKTLGYLIPACEHVRVNKERQVIVATATINLMDQIVRKDWQALTSSNDSPYRGLKISILKGKRNYLCASAVKNYFLNIHFEEAEHDRSISISDQRIAWIYLFQVLTRKNGQWDRADSSIIHSSTLATHGDILAEDVCKPNLCRMESYCCYPQAVRRAQYADVVITNHHKLPFIEDAIKERTSLCIIDEADQFPDNLRKALSESLIRDDVLDLTRRVGIRTEKRRCFVDVMRDSIEANLLKVIDANTCLDSLAKIETSCHHVNTRLWNSTMLKACKPKRWQNLYDNEQLELTTTLNEIIIHFTIIEHALKKIANQPMIDQKTNKVSSDLIERMERYTHDFAYLGQLSQLLLNAISDPKYVVTFGQDSYNWTISMMPFDILEHVLKLRKDFETVAYTSATLYVDKTTNLFTLELFNDPNYDDSFTALTKISPPFNYAKQVNGAITPFLQGYCYPPTSHWKSEISKVIALQSVALDGRTLVLFNSWAEMNDIHDRLHPIFRDFDIPLLIQDKHGSSEKLIQEFQGFEESVLLGTGRFWSGVDFPGPTLSQLIIIRPPNSNPKEPLLIERKERWGKQLSDFWYRSHAHRKLHQGFGRLIRKNTDQGLFLILDSRVAAPMNMMSSYQESIPVSLKTDIDSPIDLANWSLKRLGLTPELKERGIDLKQAYEKIERMIDLGSPSEHSYEQE